MSLAKIRQVPVPEPSDIERDLARLREVSRMAQERDGLIRSLRERGVPAKKLAEAAGVTHQRVYQVAAGTNGHARPRGGRSNGNGST